MVLKRRRKTVKTLKLQDTNVNPEHQPKYPLPLRAVLIVPFVLQISTAVGLTGYLSIRNGQQAVTDLVSQLQDNAGDRVEQYLDTYFALPHQINRLNADTFTAGLLDPKDLTKGGRFLWQQANLFPEISLIYYTLKEGQAVGSGRWLDGKNITIDEISPRTKGRNIVYATDAQGNRTQVLDIYDYDPITDPAYQATLKRGQPYWEEQIDIMEEYGGYMAASLSYPLINSQGEIIGTTTADLLLTNISQFLGKFKISPQGRVVVLERNGLVLGHSIDQPIAVSHNGKMERLSVFESPDRMIRGVATQLKQRFGSFDQIQETQNLSLVVDSEHLFVRLIPWQDSAGLNQLILMVLPESDFIAQINANKRLTILLCFGALGTAILLGIWTSQWIARPVLQLNKASRAIASGQLNQELSQELNQELSQQLSQMVTSSPIAEFSRLSESFNDMATQLQQSFNTLETANQELATLNTELEHRVEERTIELKQAKITADRANKAKSEFLANMSHELRTPLNGILGYAQILSHSKALPEKARHGVSIIHQCGSHLLDLINDVLDLSKIEARKLELTPHAVHLPSLLQAVAEICQIRAEQKGIDFRYDVEASLPEGITVDEKRLRQVLINLLGNAIKFTDRGCVTCKVTQVASGTLSTRLQFLVTDTGVGIAPDQIHRLFKSFEQVGDATRRAEGTGLGLAISQQIVQLMGGQIEVESQLGQGSKFFFTIELPLAIDWRQQQAVLTHPLVGYSGDRRQILVIDDRWENRSVLVNLLEPLGFDVIEAENGQDGLDKLRFNQPDIVVTDLAMPVMNGFEFLKQVRSDEELKATKVIISSASVSQLDQQMSWDAGGDDFLAKPIEAQVLFQMLSTHLHLVWIDESPADEPTEAEADSTEMAIPSHETLAKLLHLASRSNLKALREELEQLIATHRNYALFAQPILELAKQFQTEEIEDLLQKILAGESDHAK